MKFDLEYHNSISINIILPFQEVSRLSKKCVATHQNIDQRSVLVKIVATKFNFSNPQIVLFSLAVFRFHIVFDLLLQFAYNFHNHVPSRASAIA